MTVKLMPFDPADHLHDEGDMAAYLAAAAEEGDDAAIMAALNVIARARNMAQLARDTGLTRAGLYKALAPGGNPSFATVAKVARAMGFQVTFAPLQTSAG